jgi:hypothetical protein
VLSPKASLVLPPAIKVTSETWLNRTKICCLEVRNRLGALFLEVFEIETYHERIALTESVKLLGKRCTHGLLIERYRQALEHLNDASLAQGLKFQRLGSAWSLQAKASQPRSSIRVTSEIPSGDEDAQLRWRDRREKIGVGFPISSFIQSIQEEQVAASVWQRTSEVFREKFPPDLKRCISG